MLKFSLWQKVKIHFAKRDFLAACSVFANLAAKNGIGTSLLGGDGYSIGLFVSNPREVNSLNEWIEKNNLFNGDLDAE